MLTISIQPQTTEVRLKVDGDLTGVGVRELETCWRLARSTFGSLPTEVDLTDCGRVDDAGHYLLALLHENGARLIPGCIEMVALVDSIARDWLARAAPAWNATRWPSAFLPQCSSPKQMIRIP